MPKYTKTAFVYWVGVLIGPPAEWRIIAEAGRAQAAPMIWPTTGKSRPQSICLENMVERLLQGMGHLKGFIVQMLGSGV